MELARKVNLHRTEKPEEGAPEVRGETTTGVLARRSSSWKGPGADEDVTRDPVRKGVVEADTALEGPALGQFLDMVISLNATWRITAAWDGEHEGQRSTMLRALAAWDCGPLGYWIREQPEEPILPGQVDPDSALVLVKSNSVEVWGRSPNLLPDKEELLVADE
ncbi:hypothetical protein ACFQ7I_10855 [Streptomyces massasporeus]